MKRRGSSDSSGAFITIPQTNGFRCMPDEEGSSGHVEKKRLLNEDRVRALEKNFEIENKLEPERKLKLAQELGLQPRQVAVWFQNRRARWKTKQLERDYGVLKSNYDALRLRVESLEQDNETLITEVRELRLKLKEDSAEDQVSVKGEEMMVVVASEDDDEIDREQSEPNSGCNGFKSSMMTEVSVMADSKDGPSDSDSSAILHEEHSPIAADSSYHDRCIFPCHFVMGSSDYQPQLMKLEEHDLFGEEECNFYSEDQAPTLQWNSIPDHWN